MPLPMARPVKIKDSPNRQYVARIPRDVLDKARGQTVAVEIDGRQVSFRIGPTAQVVKFSLRTNDQTLARSRHRAVAEHMSNWFDTLRTGVTTLTHRQTVALAGLAHLGTAGSRGLDFAEAALDDRQGLLLNTWIYQCEHDMFDIDGYLAT